VRHTQGMGLGLSLYREIMRLHDGEILLKSEPGLGTTVTLFFPQGEDPTAGTEP